MELRRGQSMKTKSFYQTYKLILKIAGEKSHKLKKTYLAFILSSAFTGICYVMFFPLLTLFFNDNFEPKQALWYLLVILILTLISIALKWYAFGFSYHDDFTKILHNLRLKLGDRLKTMPLQTLSRYKTGELNNTLAQKVDDSVMTMGVVAGMFFDASVMPLSVIVGFFFIDYRFGLLTLLAFPFLIPLYNYSRKGSKIGKQKSLQAHSELEANTLEYLQGLAVLRSLNQVGKNSKKLNASIDNVQNIQHSNANKATLPNTLLSTLLELIFLASFALASFYVLDGSYTIPYTLSMLIILNRLNEPVGLFIALTNIIDVAQEAFVKIEELLDKNNLPVLGNKTIKSHDISFENVDFSYEEGNQKALQNINFHIKQNSLTAIVGKSGSGKSTIIKLIMRYADPQKGSVKIGGVDVRYVSQSELMKHISVVFQDVYLFDDTILNNIRMGNPKASDKEVKIAAKKAHCEDFISRLEKGYETKIGEIGSSLSGGERQRLSIARAILKNAPIIILDEPTSALDTGSEVAVQKALDELTKSKTIIVIAHRLSTISHADNILVVEDGCIIENGKHKDLLGKNGRYAKMNEAQSRIKKWSVKDD